MDNTKKLEFSEAVSVEKRVDEIIKEEIENSVKRKKRLMRLEKEMLVDMVFNLESRNETLVNNLLELERMYNKLKEEK